MIDPLFSQYTDKSVEVVLKDLQSSFENGLSKSKIDIQKKEHGIPKQEKHAYHALAIAMHQIKSPFFLIFFIIATVSFILGEHYNAIVILLCTLFNVAVGFFQEYRAEKTLYLLKHYLKSDVLVVRDGKELRIAHKELIPGDIVILSAGDIIPADVRFIATDHLLIDQSVFTGETAAIAKNAEALPKKVTDLYKASNIGFAGTTLVSGRARAVVFATAQQAEQSKIVNLARTTARENVFSRDVRMVGNFIICLVLITLIVVFIANLLLKGTVHIFDLFMFSTALAITVIPEALPVVVTFCLSQGMMRLAQKKVIVKRLASIESLGAIEVLCADKTGTLTENILKIIDSMALSDQNPLFFATLAIESSWAQVCQSTKGFDHVLWQALSKNDQKELITYQRLQEIPFDPERKRNIVIVQKNSKYELIVRGMVEEIMHRSSLHEQQQDSIAAWVYEQEKQGHRVLAVAHKALLEAPGKHSLVESDEQALDFIGCIAFQDPLKKTAFQAVVKARNLDIMVKILSGDSKEVVGAIAHKIGLIDAPDKVVTGYEFAQQTAEQKIKTVFDSSAFARVLPEQKYEIIQLLQQKFQVAYMGDGINDAPALKLADVSLAVQDAVDIAREAADIILLRKSLMVVVDGIEEGRIILINTLKYLKTTLASTFGNFYSVALVSLMIDYLPMLPIHLLLTNILTDLPMIAISTDHVSYKDLKHRKIAQVKDIIGIALILAIVSSIFDCIYFAFFRNNPPLIVQSGWCIFSIFTGVVFIFSMRTKDFFLRAAAPSKGLVAMAIVTIIIILILPHYAWSQRMFSLQPLTVKQIGFIMLLVSWYFCTTELVKYVYFYRKR